MCSVQGICPVAAEFEYYLNLITSVLKIIYLYVSMYVIIGYVVNG